MHTLPFQLYLRLWQHLQEGSTKLWVSPEQVNLTEVQATAQKLVLAGLLKELLFTKQKHNYFTVYNLKKASGLVLTWVLVYCFIHSLALQVKWSSYWSTNSSLTISPGKAEQDSTRYKINVIHSSQSSDRRGKKKHHYNLVAGLSQNIFWYFSNKSNI